MKGHFLANDKNCKSCPAVTSYIRNEIRAHIESKKMKARKGKAKVVERFEPEVVFVKEQSSDPKKLKRPAVTVNRSLGSSSGSKSSINTKVKSLSLNKSENLKDIIKNRKTQPLIVDQLKKDERLLVDRLVAKAFYSSGIPFNVRNNTDFQVMCEAIGRYGWGYVPPTVNRLRGPLLEAEVAIFEEMRKKHEIKWSMDGCTLMSDGWTDQKGRTIINFLVNSDAGSFYLYSIDASSSEKTAEFIARTLDDAMQNVGVKNVVQICTDNAANYVRAGKILMDKYPHLHWTPCVAHCIDLILEDIGKIPTFKKVINSGRQITSYIYGHSILHSEFLQLSGNKELVRCGVTRFATSFLTLQSLRENRFHLEKLDWQKWLEVGSGEEVHRNVFARAFWAGVDDCLKASQPLVALLRLVDSDHTPCMGFISQFFDKANSTIDTHFVDKPVLLKTLKGILKKRLEKHFNHDLFHAGAFLNPQFYYELKKTLPDHPLDFERSRHRSRRYGNRYASRSASRS